MNWISPGILTCDIASLIRLKPCAGMSFRIAKKTRDVRGPSTASGAPPLHAEHAELSRRRAVRRKSLPSSRNCRCGSSSSTHWIRTNVDWDSSCRGLEFGSVIDLI